MTETRGRDFEYFKVVTVNGVADFPVKPQATITIKGPIKMMFVCRSGTLVEYSFNGTTVHGRISAGEQFNFGTRGQDKIFVKGTGEIDVHAWHIGV